MLYLHTGLPGHGKTLNTLKEVDAQAVAQDRPVYYHNIADLDASKLKANWYLFEDPHKWYELPDNCIIVIDECQHFFQPRDVRKDRPEHIAQFQTHRHKGMDIHLTTQDFRFIDVEVRRLVGNHVHYWRPWGMSKVARYEYEKCSDFEKVSEREFAKKTFVTIDKRLFGAYKSAVGHHVKVKLPLKVIAIPVVAVVVLVLCYRVYDRIYGPKGEASEAVVAQSEEKPKQASALERAASVIGFTPNDSGAAPMTTAQYVQQRLPRVPDLPSSAPVYDELTRPVSYPRLYCMSSVDPTIVEKGFDRAPYSVRAVRGRLTHCQCYTQQGTRYRADFDFCMKASTDGYFDASVPDRRTNQGGVFQSPGQLPQQQIATYQPQPSANPAPVVNVVPYEKGRFLW